MNQNNVKHLVGFLFFVFYTFSRLFSKIIQVEICQEWTKLFTSQGLKFISEGFYPCVYRCIRLNSQFPSN